MKESDPREAPRVDKSGNAEILEAAAQCFMQQGFHATSIDDVARYLGSTKGRIYHYYRSKTDLFFDVHREGMRRNFEAVEPAVKRRADGATRLHEMLFRHALSMMENLAYETVVVQGVHMHRLAATTPAPRQTLDELMRIRNEFEDLFKSAARDGVADGSIRVPDVSVAIKAALGALNWICVWYRPRPGETREHRELLASQMVDTVMHGFATAAPAA